MSQNSGTGVAVLLTKMSSPSDTAAAESSDYRILIIISGQGQRSMDHVHVGGYSNSTGLVVVDFWNVNH